MSVAARVATDPSQILGKVHLIVPLAVMGILVVMVLPMPTVVMDLLRLRAG
jgi:flagellar biosynthesis component FlhA